MIVGDLDVVGVALSPAKAHSPLIVDADAVLSVPLARELLQLIAWWNPQILERFRFVLPLEVLTVPACTVRYHRPTNSCQAKARTPVATA